ncbi:hypothetical protein IRP63_07265 [Clostridium botulinum]|uniref:Uncharacterized protein n=3 Tax=Clostridium botulinum TaxID=1491 RepID=A0A9Q1UXS8_CLOBO|nr:hypothetical protein [Clostridium botulinum]AEB75964.1 hypothetical protein CbC4_1284 [Clostridium botulinum BKT015925]KEI00045.1 hypothetical protein Y848_12265 [Clostridium botulinum C/D str. Sp77]KEI01368.1 hypothetical protein Z953_08655 [Clostridium botulinum D str. 16868]KEI07073.1 hypothetical protein Z952_02220 [Clostridium botulinum C/D str. BKT75002]KEI12150.1 hypothetical protein Z954_06365 [Clostridium botulinum C/D str. BKT2873]
MKIAFNFKEGRREVIDEENTQKLIDSINFLKVAKYLMGSKKPNKIGDMSFVLSGERIKVSDLKSVELIL